MLQFCDGALHSCLILAIARVAQQLLPAYLFLLLMVEVSIAWRTAWRVCIVVAARTVKYVQAQAQTVVYETIRLRSVQPKLI